MATHAGCSLRTPSARPPGSVPAPQPCTHRDRTVDACGVGAGLLGSARVDGVRSAARPRRTARYARASIGSGARGSRRRPVRERRRGTSSRSPATAARPPLTPSYAQCGRLRSRARSDGGLSGSLVVRCGVVGCCISLLYQTGTPPSYHPMAPLQVRKAPEPLLAVHLAAPDDTKSGSTTLCGGPDIQTPRYTCLPGRLRAR